MTYFLFIILFCVSDTSQDKIEPKENQNSIKKEKLLISRSTQTLSTLCTENSLETKIEINDSINENSNEKSHQSQEILPIKSLTTTIIDMKNDNSFDQPILPSEQQLKSTVPITKVKSIETTKVPVTTSMIVSTTISTTPVNTETTRQNSVRSIKPLHGSDKTTICSVTNSTQSSTVIDNGPTIVGESDSV